MLHLSFRDEMEYASVGNIIAGLFMLHERYKIELQREKKTAMKLLYCICIAHCEYNTCIIIIVIVNRSIIRDILFHLTISFKFFFFFIFSPIFLSLVFNFITSFPYECKYRGKKLHFKY